MTAAAAAMLLFSSAPARAETGALGDWSIIFTPYAWIPVIEGSIKINDSELPIDASVADLLRNSDRAAFFLGSLEVRYKRFGIYADSTYLKMGFDNDLAFSGRVSTDLEFTFVDFGINYRILEGAPRTVQPWTVDLLAGGRYSSQDYQIKLPDVPPILPGVPNKVGVDKSWIDPIVGARVILEMSRRVRLSIIGDVGGFGVGSEISTQGQATLGYRWYPGNFELEAAGGYRALYQRVDFGGDTAALDYDATIHGPILRFGIGY